MKLNRNGQTLVLFLIILPLIVLICTYLLLTVSNINKKEKIEKSIKSNMEFSLQEKIKDIDKIEKVLKRNIDNNIKVLVQNDTLIIKVYYQKEWLEYCGDYSNLEIKKGSECNAFN